MTGIKEAGLAARRRKILGVQQRGAIVHLEPLAGMSKRWLGGSAKRPAVLAVATSSLAFRSPTAMRHGPRRCVCGLDVGVGVGRSASVVGVAAAYAAGAWPQRHRVFKAAGGGAQRQPAPPPHRRPRRIFDDVASGYPPRTVPRPPMLSRRAGRAAACLPEEISPSSPAAATGKSWERRSSSVCATFLHPG